MAEWKSEEEIGRIRRAGRVVALCHDAIAKRIAPGVTTLEIDRFVERLMAEHGAYPAQKGYRGYPYATCASVGEVVCHGFPDAVPLQEGDIVTIDMVADVDGWKADSAWTYAIGKGDSAVQSLMAGARQAMLKGIGQCRVGRRIGDIGAAVVQSAKETGHSVVSSFAGHGIGRSIHEPPEVNHVSRGGSGAVLQPGMVLTVEPILTAGGPEVWIAHDGWTARTSDRSWSAQYEHTVAITEQGPVILTCL
ncbi:MULTISPECIES: type I methionyl aminopeptidase [unclassified Paenibacillus]|uniref:type I methionyl aminopeptidase n=1 Tax=unclassified Paenibacillus TaxID=185978 RepID=UPI0009567577|nr:MULTISPECIES: type I methionyl aminopeptidase [unclassified Paenibacillus]ASS69299.1 type I methionyl aminopeptidase [Paenibacillus sp. RUD330]SIQ88843.1 methionyl aminopeptidase [Paenibacillus sp. RU4X]SIR09789.1 methionyl aminopeptidase [Paenibacillus sp. RU4T]